MVGGASFTPPSHPLQSLEHHAAWFEDLFELPNSFDPPTHSRVRVMHFYDRGELANSRNRQVQISEKRGMNVFERIGVRNRTIEYVILYSTQYISY